MAHAVDDDGPDLVFESAGRRAREEVLAITRMADSMRLASFRAYLASAVDLMPTILPAVSASFGVPLSEALQRLRPSAAWPACAGRKIPKPSPRRLPSFAALGRRWSANAGSADVYAHPLRIGAALISDGALADWVEVAASGRWLEVAMRSDAFELATHEGVARLKLEGRLPEVALSTCMGRRLEDVADHALLRDRGFVVDSAIVLGNQTILQFRIGGSSVAFPWRD